MDHRVDLYAFGILAYEMLTGQPPFAGRSPQAILGAHVAAVPEPVSARRPGLPPLLVALVMKCLEKRPADRPQTAAELISALDMMTTPSGVSVPVHPPTVVVQPPSRAALLLRRFGPLAAGIIGVGAALLLWHPWSPAPPASEPAPSAPAATAQRPLDLPRPAAPVVAVPPRTEADSAAPSPAAPTPSKPQADPTRRRATEEQALLRRLRTAASTARGRAVRAGASAELLAQGDSDIAAADSLASLGRVALAAAELSAAAARWSDAERAAVSAMRIDTTPSSADTVAAEPPPARPAAPPAPAPAPTPAPVAPAPADPAREIDALVDAYAAAIESRSLPAIRRVYPTLQPSQAREWEQFFDAVAEIDVELRVAVLQVSDGSADAELAGVYSFTDPSSRRLKHENVRFSARLRRDSSGWRIESLR
jgi:hypothetical protein